MTNKYYEKLKRDIVKDVISLILIGIAFIGICAGLVYIFK